MAAKKNKKKRVLKPATPDAGAFQRLRDFVRRLADLAKGKPDAKDRLQHNRKNR